jgi:hypothetical protein
MEREHASRFSVCTVDFSLIARDRGIHHLFTNPTSVEKTNVQLIHISKEHNDTSTKRG